MYLLSQHCANAYLGWHTKHNGWYDYKIFLKKHGWVLNTWLVTTKNGLPCPQVSLLISSGVSDVAKGG